MDKPDRRWVPGQYPSFPSAQLFHSEHRLMRDEDGRFCLEPDRLERGLPPAVVTLDVGYVSRRRRLLAQALRAERPDARRGDFFAGTAAAEFKRVLAVLMDARVWAVIMDDNPGALRHHTNAAYPGGKTFSTMPGVVLAALPQLPDGLEFRFLGTSLVIYDVRANIIIDTLHDAIQCDHCHD